MKLGQVAAPYILIYVCLLSRLNRQASVQKQREKYSIFMVFFAIFIILLNDPSGMSQ